MNILLVNHYAGSHDMGMEFRPYYMAKEWSKYNVKTMIVAGSYSHVRSIQPAESGLKTIDGIDYLWLWTNKYKGNGLLRLISMFVFIIQLFLKIPYFVFKFKPSVVIASSTYPLDILPCYVIAKLSKAKLVFEIHDLWPLSPMELGGMSKYHPFIIIMRFAEWFAYKFSDKIVSILPHTYAHVAKDGVKKHNFLHVPNGVVTDYIEKKHNKNIETIKYIKNNKRDGKVVIAYGGSIGISNNLETLIDAAQLIHDEPIMIYIIGNGPQKQKLKEMVADKNLVNVVFINKVSKDDLQSILSKCDLLYLGLQKQSLYRFGISLNKLYDYMLAAKPIIAAMEVSNNTVEIAKCGFSVAAEDPLALADIIKIAIKTPSSELKAIGENGKKYVLEHHNYNILAKKFLDFIS